MRAVSWECRYVRGGFTVVELLIVVVVIAILAAITLVAFTGVREQAQASAAAAELQSASKEVALWSVRNSGAYPTNLASAQAGGMFEDSTTLNYSTPNNYIVNNSTNPANYCVTGVATDGKEWSTSSTLNGRVVAGRCVTNIMPYPQQGSLNCGSGATQTSNVTWGGRSDWRQVSFAGGGQCRIKFSLSDLENGSAYNVSFTVANTGVAVQSIASDFCDTGTNPVPASSAMGVSQQGRLSYQGQRATYDATYRFQDIASITQPATYLIVDMMVTKGSTLYSYGDGGTAGWFWNGTPGASTSTGPAVAQ